MSRGISNTAAGKQSWSCPIPMAAIWKTQCLKVVWMGQLSLWAMWARGVLPWELGAVTLQNQCCTTSRTQAMGQCYQKLLLSISECEKRFDKKKKTPNKTTTSRLMKACLGCLHFFCSNYKENACILRALQNEFIYLLLGRYLCVELSKEKILFLWHHRLDICFHYPLPLFWSEIKIEGQRSRLPKQKTPTMFSVLWGAPIRFMPIWQLIV